MAATATSNPTVGVIALLRVSTDAQDVARQRTDIEKLKTRFGVTVLRIVELVGVSGTATLENEDVQQILAELQRPEVHGIAISSLDRLFRPGKKWAQWAILDYFADANKVIYSQREGLIDPNTSEGYEKCMSAGGRAGAEWRIIKERSMDGKLEKAKEGFLPYSNARYGYNIIGRKQTGVIGKGRAEINEAEAAVVREIFDMALHDVQTYDIAARLNARGILNKGTQGKPPKPWFRTTVLQTLNATDYIGQHSWRGVIIPVPRIVSDEVFYGVHAKMKQRKLQWSGRPSKLYLLRGYLFCGRCGHRCGGARKGASQGRKAYYHCNHMTLYPPKRRVCSSPYVSREAIEAAAWGALWSLLKNPALLIEMGRAAYAGQDKPDVSKAARLKKQIAKLQNRDGNLKSMQEDAATPAEYAECRTKRSALRTEIASLEVELRECEKVVIMPSLSALEKHLETITTGAEPKTYDERRPILEALVDLHMTYADGQLQIEGKVPVSTPAAASPVGGQNCYPVIRADSSSATSIPFILKLEVA